MKKIYLFITLILLITIKINAQNWITCGPGTALGNNSNGVRAIAVSPYDGSIYAGGTFTGTVNYLAKYNPTTDSWQAVGAGVGGPVYALKFFKGKLYVGGLFSTAGGVGANNIVAVNSAGVYNTVGIGLNGQVNCFESSMDSAYLYVGGQFSADFSNSTTLLHIAKTDLITWSAVGSGITPVVNCLTYHNNLLHAGTQNVSDQVLSLSGSTWTPISGLAGGKVYTIASFGGYLYAGGDFTSPNPGAAKYNNSTSTWGTIITSLLPGTVVRTLKTYGNYLFIGGSFTSVGIGPANYFGRIDGPNIPIKAIITSNYPASTPYAIANKDGYIYLGGNFTNTGENVIRSSTTIGVDEIDNIIESSSFFPNPLSTTATLNVKLKKHADSAKVSIIDAQGKIVQEKMISDLSNNEINFTIDRNDLSAGIYYYQLTIDGQAASTHPFVIE